MLPLFCPTLVVGVAFAGDGHGHSGLAVAAEHLSLQGVLPSGCGTATLNPLVFRHPGLNPGELILVDNGRDGILHPDYILPVFGVGVPGAVCAVGRCPIDQRTDVFFIFQQVVEGIRAEGVSPFGFDAVPVQPGDDIVI